METKRVWVLYTKAECPQLNVVAQNSVYSFKSENAIISVGDVVYIYSLYLGKMRFKTIVSSITNNYTIYLSIEHVYRGKELSTIENLNNRPIHNLLFEITDKSLALFIETKFEQDKIEQQYKLPRKPQNTSAGAKDSKMPIGLVISIICIAIVLIGLLVLIIWWLDGSLIFAICAFIGLCGMVGKELFK